MFLRQIFDPSLAQYSYVIGCQATGEAIVIDPQRDIDRYHKIAEENDLKISAIADTHIHADYLSGAREFGASDSSIKMYLSSAGEPDWPYAWAKDMPNAVFLKDGDEFAIGNLTFRAMTTPGHTPEHMIYFVTHGGAHATTPIGICSGDFLFVGDLGRPDLLESAAGQQGIADPSARALYNSVRKFAGSGEEIQVWPAHGAGSACGKALGAVPMSTVGYEKKYNEGLRIGMKQSEQDFVDFILSNQPEPPLYWAEMKRLNRDGAPVLGKLPKPQRLTPERLAQIALSGEATLVDTRISSKEFFSEHVARSLYAPLNNNFSQWLGSFIPLETPIVLLLDCESKLDLAIRELIRVGFDNIVGWIPVHEALVAAKSQDLRRHIDTMPRSDMAKALASYPNPQILDVRRASEFAEEHDEGAINIAHTRIYARRNELPQDKTLLVRCATGGRAAGVAATLAAQGFNVVHLDS